MKTFIRFSLRLFATVAPLGLASLAAATTDHPDAAVHLLATRGTIPVSAAGPHVQPGTFRVQVAAKLGRPDFVLADGTWLYQRRRVHDSDAEGTLVVQFRDGRVSSLELASPAVALALRERQAAAPQTLVATR